MNELFLEIKHENVLSASNQQKTAEDDPHNLLKLVRKIYDLTAQLSHLQKQLFGAGEAADQVKVRLFN